ncbi:ATP-binding protein [Streptomyces sp. PTM05]|uniref:ATP-binding protein n=1 Tax=Streptantibioticus parmotrematis TaxID=2873249 RepID=A0ABS7QQV9_9ACTN|nr:ATP-binding protein [Streptantibioticus parmotrematis]MBY8885576.1 ATP-binding protein [Streptantibioticus parmotrematis]
MTTHPVGSPAHSAGDGSRKHWLAAAAEGAFTSGDEGRGASGFAACALEGEPQAVPGAREFIRSTLDGWGMAALCDDAAVVGSELLGNALRHGLTGCGERPLSPHPIWLGLLRRGDTVLCAVSDPSPETPCLRAPDDLATSGRGLRVVDCLSDSWGWTEPDVVGKAVWAVVSGNV